MKFVQAYWWRKNCDWQLKTGLSIDEQIQRPCNIKWQLTVGLLVMHPLQRDEFINDYFFYIICLYANYRSLYVHLYYYDFYDI